jgi:hypothetical protein
MVKQKFILVRRQVSFTILPSDEKPDTGHHSGWGLPTGVTDLADLPKREKTERVTVLIPLKTLAVEEAMPEVQKMLTPTGAVSMLSKMNTLVVVDTAGNVKRIADTLAKADAKKPEAPVPATPKKLSLQMKDQPWEKVLEWYGEAAGLKPLYTVKLSGTFSHTPPTAETRYTVAEVTDLLNDALAKQKLLLIRRPASFSVVSTEDQPQQLWSLVQRIERTDLPDWGRTEMVQVMIGLRHVAAEDIMPQIQKMVTPLGAATWLPKQSNFVIVVDRVENIRRIAQFIADAEAAEGKK